jgi:hypothetical protein
MKKKPAFEDEPKSQVIQLLDLVYDATWKDGKKIVWSRVNSAMQAALKIAIGSGFKWDVDDWKHVMSHYNCGFWIGDNIEWWYSECVSASNISAIVAYETYVDRKPFIADCVTPTKCDLAHSTGSRERERLAIGFEFYYQGQRVVVNSFGVDGSYLNATDWRGYETGKTSTKKIKRHKITREMIQADRAENKERAALFEELEEVANKLGKHEEIGDRLEIKKSEEKASIPIEKLRAIVEEYRKLGMTQSEE